MVTRRDLVAGLQELGLRSGDCLLVHSSLSSFGRLEGGAATFIGAAQEAVSPGGLIMMPAFTFGRQPFDVNRTPSQTGRVSEEFRTWPGVVRSGHATHSVTAWGSRATWFTAGHRTEVAFAPGSPLHRVSEVGGKVLLVGVGHAANSMLHVAQELALVPYLDRAKIVEIVEADGRMSRMKVRRAGCSVGFDRIASSLEPAMIEEAVIGRSDVRCFLAGPLVEIAVALQRDDPAALLCVRPDCYACNEARSMIAAA